MSAPDEPIDQSAGLVSLLRGERPQNGASFTEAPFLFFLARAEQFHKRQIREDLAELELELSKYRLTILSLFTLLKVAA